MRRPHFLRAGAGLLAVASLPPLTRRASASDLVNVTLTAQPAAEGGLAYNGSIPGPFLRVVRGQRVRVNYLSRVAVPTSVHWHGMLLPNAMDGVAGVTQPPRTRSNAARGSWVAPGVPAPPADW